MLIVGLLPDFLDFSKSFLRENGPELVFLTMDEGVVVRRRWTISCKRLSFFLVTCLIVVSSNRIAPVVVSVTSIDVVVGRDGRGGIGMISKSLVFSGSSKVS